MVLLNPIGLSGANQRIPFSPNTASATQRSLAGLFREGPPLLPAVPAQ